MALLRICQNIETAKDYARVKGKDQVYHRAYEPIRESQNEVLKAFETFMSLGLCDSTSSDVLLISCSPLFTTLPLDHLTFPQYPR